MSLEKLNEAFAKASLELPVRFKDDSVLIDANCELIGDTDGLTSNEKELIALSINTMPALLEAVKLAQQVAAQDPFTFSEDAPLPYRQLANIVNAYQSAAKTLLAKLQVVA